MADGGPKNVEAIHRLTPVQEGILFHAEGGGGAQGAYLLQFSCLLVGDLDRARFEGAWRAVIQRHTALRTLYTWRGRPHPLGVVRGEVDFRVEWVEGRPELIGATPSEGEDSDPVADWMGEHRRDGLDLERAPVFRVAVAAGEEGRARLLWTFHHVSLDGWSMRVVLDELLRAYGGEDLSVIAPGPGQAAMMQWLDARDPEPGRAHWRARFEGWEGPRPLPALVDPVDRVPDPVAAAADSAVDLGPERTERLLEVARGAGVTPAVVVRAAWTLVLSRLTDSSDVVFGTTVAGRPPEIPRVEEGVGMFIGTIPVRAIIPWERTVDAWLRQLHGEQLADSAHEQVSLSTIQRDVLGGGGGELFDAILVVENHAERSAADAGLTIEQPRFVERSHYDMALLVVPGTGGWRLEVLCDPPLRAGAAVGMLDQLVDAICAAPGDTVADAVDDVVLDRAPGEAREWAPPELPADALERMLDGGSPDAPAIVHGDEVVTWGRFRERVASVRRRFQAAGLEPHGRLGIRMERGVDALVAMVAALRSGIVYAPIDPAAPAERVESMVRSAGLDRVMDGLADLPPDPGGDEPRARSSEGLAYILFTSGSTGEPKGVEITLDGLLRSTLARPEVYGGDAEVFLLLSPLHFDSSVAGIYWTMLSGGALVLPLPGEERDPSAILGAIERHRVTHTLMLPSLWGAILDTESPRLAGLDTVVVAGEACTDALVGKHFAHLPGVRLFNEYGPTEATVWATVAEARPGRPIGIGDQIPGLLAWVVDHRGRPAARGTVGELVLAGPALARGYAGDPARTEAAFATIEHPRYGPLRAYRTGDRVRERVWAGADGDRLDYHGRGDDQVKIRGQRIELGDVEAAAVGAPGVAEAAATTVGSGGVKRLVLFVRGAGGSLPSEQAVGEWLGRRLSGAMLPSRIVALADFPRTPTGKVDRGALSSAPGGGETPDEADATSSEVRKDEAALDGATAALRDVWIEVLGIQSVGVEDDFFALGGDSLASIRLLARAHRLGVKLSPSEFAEEPTIAGMVRRAGTVTALPSTGAGATGSFEPSLLPAQRWFLEKDEASGKRWNLTRVVTFEGEDPSMESIQRALEVVVLRHPALRTGVLRGRDGQAALGAAAESWSVRVASANAFEADPAAALHDHAARTGDAMIAAAFLPSGGAGGSARRILLSAAHIAIDAVSLGIIEDELRAILAGEPLGAAPVSAGAWGAELERFAASDAAAAELPHWSVLESADGALDLGEPGSVKDEVACEARLDADRSARLGDDVHAAFGTTTLDLLALAVARAVGGGRDHVLLDMETHGREPHLSSLDASRTVGWFTALWPHVVASGGSDLGDLIRRTKDDLRAVPGKGAGFGPLRWSHPDEAVRARLAALPRRELLLNHLGTTDGAPVPDEAVVGALRSPELPRGHAVEVITWVDRTTGLLTVRVAVSGAVHGSARAGEIAGAVVSELEAIIDHCLGADGPGATPADFPLAGLDQAGLDRLGDLLGD